MPGPRAVLDELARAGVRADVELHLATGTVLRGALASVSDDRAGAFATLEAGRGRTFVRLDQLVAVTVLDAKLLDAAAPDPTPAPGKLELARMLADAGKRVPLRPPADLDEDGRRALAALLPVLDLALAVIGADAMGSSALAGITAIELHVAADGEVARPDPRRLVIHAPTKRSQRFTADSLRAALEAVL